MAKIKVAVGIVWNKAGRVLIARRKVNTHQGGLWEFPGGKFEQAEDTEQALSRELFEELNIKPKDSNPLISIKFNYPEYGVHLYVRDVYDYDGEVAGQEGQLLKWVSVQELRNYQFPAANRAILSAIRMGRQYAIIGGDNLQQVLCNIESAAAHGVSLIQIRLSELCTQQVELLVQQIRLQCHARGISYLINSQMPVTKILQDGVHLTSNDLMCLKQRPESVGFVAASCHNLKELRKAEALGLDFVVLSPVKKTNSHPGSSTLGWSQFTQWVADINIPVFALGGMTMHDYDNAISCGAQGIAGISLYQ